MVRHIVKIVLTAVILLISTPLYGQINPYTRQLRGPRRMVIGGEYEKIDSTAMHRRDSLRAVALADSLRTLPKDSLLLVSDSIRMSLPDTLRTQIFKALQDSVASAEHKRRRAERKAGREPFISDSMSLRKMTMCSAVMPGFGQIYNKDYWKLPILYTGYTSRRSTSHLSSSGRR